jgi:hypothetical protein
LGKVSQEAAVLIVVSLVLAALLGTWPAKKIRTQPAAEAAAAEK